MQLVDLKSERIVLGSILSDSKALDAVLLLIGEENFTLPQHRLIFRAFKSLDNNQLGLDDMLNTIIDNTFKKNHDDSYLNEVQQMVNLNVLKYIMNLAISDESFFQVKALANAAIRDIVLTSFSLDAYKMQYNLLIQQYSDNPTDFKLPSSPGIPDGSPIGSDICNYNPN